MKLHSLCISLIMGLLLAFSSESRPAQASVYDITFSNVTDCDVRALPYNCSETTNGSLLFTPTTGPATNIDINTTGPLTTSFDTFFDAIYQGGGQEITLKDAAGDFLTLSFPGIPAAGGSGEMFEGTTITCVSGTSCAALFGTSDALVDDPDGLSPGTFNAVLTNGTPVSPIPEPASSLLFLSGLIGALGVFRQLNSKDTGPFTPDGRC